MRLRPAQRKRLWIGAAVTSAFALLGCVRYVASPEDVASARLGEKITVRVMGLDAGEEERRQALLEADYCLFSGVLWRADAGGETDAGFPCRMPTPGKDSGK